MLTQRKQLFINNYILTLNATKAAELSKYSLRTAYSQGSRLLNNVEVKQEIDKRLQEIERKNEISKEAVLEKLWKESNCAQRSADRISALLGVSRICGYIKDVSSTQVTAVFPKYEAELKAVVPIDVTPCNDSINATSL